MGASARFHYSSAASYADADATRREGSLLEA